MGWALFYVCAVVVFFCVFFGLYASAVSTGVLAVGIAVRTVGDEIVEAIQKKK